MESLWLKLKRPEYPRLEGAVSADAVVIGGGIAGLNIAFALQSEGLKVVLLEADRVCRGTSGHTTAKITSQHDLIYRRLTDEQGHGRAQGYALAQKLAMEQLRQWIEIFEIDCDYEQKEAYVFTSRRGNIKKLERECEAANELGLGADICHEADFPLKFEAALRFHNQAQFHPVKYMLGVLGLLDKTEIYERTRATGIDDTKVLCERGSVSAKYVVIAAHAPFVNFPGWFFARQYQHKSYVLALTGAPKMDGMFISLEKDGHSFRTYGEYTLLGGADHRVGSEAGKNHYMLLEDAAKGYFPSAEPVMRWSAQDCMPPDHIPYIGAYSRRHPNVFVATGFGKWGMTNSVVAAQIIRNKILERPEPFGDVFSPLRDTRIHAAAQIAVNVGNAVAHTASSLARMDKPTCTHMGCKTSWNTDDCCYECPCHGSRFDANGEPLDGPANKKLR